MEEKIVYIVLAIVAIIVFLVIGFILKMIMTASKTFYVIKDK